MNATVAIRLGWDVEEIAAAGERLVLADPRRNAVEALIQPPMRRRHHGAQGGSR